MSGPALGTLLRAELTRPAPGYALVLAQELARRGGPACAAVLYYGSALRAGTPEGILDFYVLMDDVRAWPGSWWARQANRWLPPNVGYLELPFEGSALRAKYAVMSPAQFAARVRVGSGDTTIWARFCQPALCVWSRDEAALAETTQLVAGAVTCAAQWAARLAPRQAPPAEFWRTLFAHTYAAEVRVERSGRPQDIVDKDPGRYATLLPLAWTAAGIAFITANDELAPQLTVAQRARAVSDWQRLGRRGRRLNVLRLLKAAFTFEGAMDYVAWKIERHRGVRIEVKPWQRRFPLLAAPGLYWRLRRMGVLGSRAPGRDS